MEYRKIINSLDNTPNEPSKFRTKNWDEINDESRGTYDANNEFKLKTSMIRSSFGDAYIRVKETVTIPKKQMQL